jgi:hypothetical protein
LIRFEFDTPTYYTDAPYPIVFDGNTYTSAGDLINIEDVTEEMGLKYDTLSVALSGVNQANIAIALSANYIDKKVVMLIGAIDVDNNIVSSPVEYYTGMVESYGIDEDMDSGTSIVTWVTASHWSSFDFVAGRRTNDDDQQFHFPGDLGLEFTSEIVTEKAMTWGK